MKKLRINWYIVNTDVDSGVDDGVEQGVEGEKGECMVRMPSWTAVRC